MAARGPTIFGSVCALQSFYSRREGGSQASLAARLVNRHRLVLLGHCSRDRRSRNGSSWHTLAV